MWYQRLTLCVCFQQIHCSVVSVWVLWWVWVSPVFFCCWCWWTSAVFSSVSVDFSCASAVSSAARKRPPAERAKSWKRAKQRTCEFILLCVTHGRHATVCASIVMCMKFLSELCWLSVFERYGGLVYVDCSLNHKIKPASGWFLMVNFWSFGGICFYIRAVKYLNGKTV